MLTLLCDGPALGYRAFYSTGDLSHEGISTGVPYGFFNAILRLGEQYKTNQFVFCWDGFLSLRKELFPDYKKHREATTEADKEIRRLIHIQFAKLRFQHLLLAGFQQQWQDGYEADDLIAKTLLDNPDMRFVIVSSDNDLHQLLRMRNCVCQHTLSGKELTASRFQQKFGVTPRDWVTVKCIAGCDTDGVPGVEGVGVKTAVKYVNSILPVGKVYERIVASDKLIQRNYKLIALPFPGLPDKPVRKDSVDGIGLFKTFNKLGFNSFCQGDMKDRWVKFVKGEWK